MEDEEVLKLWCAALRLYITNHITQGAAREEGRYPGKCSLHGVSSVPGKHKDLASILSMEKQGREGMLEFNNGSSDGGGLAFPGAPWLVAHQADLTLDGRILLVLHWLVGLNKQVMLVSAGLVCWATSAMSTCCIHCCCSPQGQREVATQPLLLQSTRLSRPLHWIIQLWVGTRCVTPTI